MSDEQKGGAAASVCIKVRRNAQNGESNSYFQEYRVPVTEKKSVLQALEYIYENQDDTLGFRRYCCGIQFCNSCMMVINGKTAHACLTILEPGTTVTLEPLPGYRILNDLIVEN